jgi:hypothetical protein
MQQEGLSLLESQKRFRIEKACQKHLFGLRWPQGYRCPRGQHDKAYFHRTRHVYACKACGYQTSLTAGTIFHQTMTPLRKWFWMIFLMGRQKSGASLLSVQRILEIRTYKTVWVMGHKIRKAMAKRDAGYKLAGLIEMDDTYVGGPKPGKRGRGAAGKSEVVVAVETPGDKTRFAAMGQVPRVSGDEIKAMAQACLVAGEFCYRFNRRFWEPQMFNRMITACLNAQTVTFSELRQ